MISIQRTLQLNNYPAILTSASTAEESNATIRNLSIPYIKGTSGCTQNKSTLWSYITQTKPTPQHLHSQADMAKNCVYSTSMQLWQEIRERGQNYQKGKVAETSRRL